MTRSLPAVPAWTEWQKATGELPPDFDALPRVNGLPDPFRFLDGREVKSPADWTARRAEIRALYEQYDIGTLPPKPPLDRVVPVEETKGDGYLTRVVRLEYGPEGKLSTQVTLTLPAGNGPFPVLIGGGGWVNALMRRGYAACAFSGSVDQQTDLPKLYPGYEFATMGQRAWTVQLVVDYLLTLPEIDRTRIAITGYSREGKMATIAAAIDERIAAVIAGSTGVGGVLSWRQGSERNQAESIESTTRMFPLWFHPRLRFFSGREDRLPIDANLLTALLAPRACLIQYGLNDEVANTWGNEQTFHSAQRVYGFLGQPDRIGLLRQPGFHGANDQDRCLDWLDIQFGRSPRAWDNDLLFPWSFDEWRERSGERLDPNTLPARAQSVAAAATSAANWEKRADEIRAAVTRLLGEAPVAVPPGAGRGGRGFAGRGPPPGPTVIARGQSGNPGQLGPDVPAWVIGRGGQEFGWLEPEKNEVESRRIRFGYNVTGDLYFPAGVAAGTRLPTVIWLHGYSYPLGYMWVYRRDLHPILALAKAGYAVLAFDQCGFGSRMSEAAPFFDRHPHWSQLGRMVDDVRGAIDALQNDPVADGQRVSLFGYSLGGMVALHAAALDARVQRVVAIGGMTPWRTDTADRGTGGIARFSHERGLVPRLGFFVGHEARIPYDLPDLLGAIAPRPVLVVQPRMDRDATPAEVRAAVTDARAAYALHNAGDRLALLEPDDYLRVPAATQNQILEWMNQTLPQP